MTPEQIREHYDRNPNLTLAELARMTGLTIAQLKKVLMP